MKNLIFKHTKLTLAVVILIAVSSAVLYAFSSGITGRTLKTTNNGCSCHEQNPDPQVVVTINAPDTVIRGQTVTCSLSVTKLSKTGAGLDIATRSGTLAPISSNIHLASGELTHNNNIPMNNGTATVQFSYTAPNSVTTDTIWATGLATNSNGNTGGDDWNWAPSKRIIVRNPTGIKQISSEVPGRFALEQNYPNPFNPSTKITFAIPENLFVTLSIFDISGKSVGIIVNENLETGTYEYKFDGSNLSSGTYFYTLKTGKFSETKKMMLVK